MLASNRLDIKRTKQDFLNKKSKSSDYTRHNYTIIFNQIEKFCISRYNSSLEELVEELSLVPEPQEQIENLLQSYIDQLEAENKPKSTVQIYSGLLKNYLKFRRVKFDKAELESNLSFKSEIKDEFYPISKKEIQSMIDNASFINKAKILCMTSGGFRISELLGVRKSDINTSHERYTVQIRAEFGKGHKARTTIISKEAMELVDQIIKDKSDNDFLFPYESRNRQNAVITSIVQFERIGKKAGLDMRYEGSNRRKITSHSFRAFFISQFEKTSSGFGHSLAGHGRYMKQYERFTLDEKLEKYIETEPHLLIYSNTEDEQKTKKKLLELQAKVSRLEEVLSQQGIKF